MAQRPGDDSLSAQIPALGLRRRNAPGTLVPTTAPPAPSPHLPGAVAAGETEEETAEMMKDAIELHLEGLKEDNLPIPEPTSIARSVEISV